MPTRPSAVRRAPRSATRPTCRARRRCRPAPAAFSVSVLARPRNSGCATSMPESTIVTGRPAGGGVSVSTPTAARHHSVGTSGSAKSSTARVPASRFGALSRRAPRARRRGTTRCAACAGHRVEAERRRDERAAGARSRTPPRCSAPRAAARRASSRPADAVRQAPGASDETAAESGDQRGAASSRICLSSTRSRRARGCKG